MPKITGISGLNRIRMSKITSEARKGKQIGSLSINIIVRGKHNNPARTRIIGCNMFCELNKEKASSLSGLSYRILRSEERRVGKECRL